MQGTLLFMHPRGYKAPAAVHQITLTCFSANPPPPKRTRPRTVWGTATI